MENLLLNLEDLQISGIEILEVGDSRAMSDGQVSSVPSLESCWPSIVSFSTSSI